MDEILFIVISNLYEDLEKNHSELSYTMDICATITSNTIITLRKKLYV